MPRTFTINVKNKQSNAVESVRVSIPDDDWNRLLAFAQYADELMSLRSVQEGLHVQIKISYSKSEGFALEGTVPSNDAIAAILHTLRPIVLQKEALSFYRTRNILSNYLGCPQISRVLDEQRDLFSGKDFQQAVRISSSSADFDGILNSEDSFQKWLNAFEYHRDNEKREEIEKLCGVLPFEIARAIFLSMLIDKIKAILNIAKIIRFCEKSDGVPLQLG